MNVFVALLAHGWSILEVHMTHSGFEVGRFVAVDAGRGTVSSHQCKRSFGVIKARQLFPGFGGMTALTAGRRAVGTCQRYAVFELALMRVGMATGATQLLPVIDNTWLRLELHRLFVAVGARHRNVPSGKSEVRVFMASQSKCRRLISFDCMAAVASVKERRCGKLCCMLVGMAISATAKPDLE